VNTSLPQQVNQVAAAAPAVIALGSMAVLTRALVTALFSNPIPWPEKARLRDKYGWWAVRRAEASCPHGDVACVEREARRLYEVTIHRRR
jgi:hypothetical protein